jgi:hypothetical protein
MSLSEFDLLLAHTRIYDAEFTRREAARAFTRARMHATDELQPNPNPRAPTYTPTLERQLHPKHPNPRAPT